MVTTAVGLKRNASGGPVGHCHTSVCQQPEVPGVHPAGVVVTLNVGVPGGNVVVAPAPVAGVKVTIGVKDGSNTS